jgi:hypothetical protein
VYSPGKVPCKANISKFTVLSVATDGSNLCSIYSTDKSQNCHHMKIPNGQYTARDPFILKHKKSRRYEIKNAARLENTLLTLILPMRRIG